MIFDEGPEPAEEEEPDEPYDVPRRRYAIVATTGAGLLATNHLSSLWFQWVSLSATVVGSMMLFLGLLGAAFPRVVGAARDPDLGLWENFTSAPWGVNVTIGATEVLGGMLGFWLYFRFYDAG